MSQGKNKSYSSLEDSGSLHLDEINGHPASSSQSKKTVEDSYVGNGEEISSLTIAANGISVENVILSGDVWLPPHPDIQFINVKFGPKVRWRSAAHNDHAVKDESALVSWMKLRKPDPFDSCWPRTKSYLKIFFFCYLVVQFWLIIGAFIFRAFEAGQYDNAVSSCNLLPVENPRNQTCDELLPWNWKAKAYDNPWTFYNSYIFAYSIAYTVGFWEWTTLTAWGQTFVVVWGVPAMAVGILAALVFANIFYKLVMTPLLRKCFCGRRAPRISPFRNGDTNNSLLMLLFLATFLGFCWYLKDMFVSRFHAPTITNQQKVFFLFCWYMTLGIADVSTYDILGNPSSNFMLFVVHQLLFVFMGVMIGTAIKLLDEFGDLVSAKLGLSEFVEDDEPSDPAEAALIGEAGKEKNADEKNAEVPGRYIPEDSGVLILNTSTM